jgi:peptidoglycan/LPS O-acetylase OafA/YrhL
MNIAPPLRQSQGQALNTRAADRRLPSLDGLRAISFLIVFISHLGFMDSRPGGFGVSVFFVISGYLITTLMIREHQKYGTVSLPHFYLRRTARIFPGMYITLLLCVVCTSFHFVDGQIQPWGLAALALYLSNYTTWYSLITGVKYNLSGTSQFWSLCVEEHFYLLFPVLFCAMLRRNTPFRKISGILASVCGLFLAWRLVAVNVIPLGENWCYLTSDARMDSILWGCSLACVEQVPQWTRSLTKKRLERYLLPIALLALVLTFFFHDSGRMTTRFTIQSLAMLVVLYYAIHFSDSPIIRPLNNPLLVHLGTLSYALYLLHNLVILLCKHFEHGGKLELWITSALFSYLAALAMHLLIERPFERLRARFRAPSQQANPTLQQPESSRLTPSSASGQVSIQDPGCVPDHVSDPSLTNA